MKEITRRNKVKKQKKVTYEIVDKFYTLTDIRGKSIKTRDNNNNDNKKMIFMIISIILIIIKMKIMIIIIIMEIIMIKEVLMVKEEITKIKQMQV